MPTIPKIQIYTNDGTEVLGFITPNEPAHGGYTVYINDVGLSGTVTPTDGYIYIMVPVNGLESRRLQMQHLRNMVRVRKLLFQQVLQYI